MKKALAIGLAAAMAVTMTAPVYASDDSESGAGIAKEDLKIGAIYIGDENEGYTAAHMAGIDEMVEKLKQNGDTEESVLYLRRLCKRSIYEGAKIRKNDGLDYSIITCLAKENIVNETDIAIDLKNTFSLTFDKNLYEFSKENSVLYNKQIYDELLRDTI